MSILRLPVETLCRIFSLSVRADYPSFMLPGPKFDDDLSQSPFDYASPDDIGYCLPTLERDRIIRSIPLVYAIPFVASLHGRTLKRTIKVLDHCLERSRMMPILVLYSIRRQPAGRLQPSPRAPPSMHAARTSETLESYRDPSSRLPSRRVE